MLVAVEGSSNVSPDQVRDVLVRNGGYVHGYESGSRGLTGTTSGIGASGLGSTGGVDTLGAGTMGSASMGAGSVSSGSVRNDDLRDRYPTTESADLRLRDIDSSLSRGDLAERERLQLLEERLFVEKHRELLGSVEVGKHVETRQQNVNVELQHEELVIERRPVNDGRPVEGNVTLGAGSETLRVDLEAERANVQKQAYVVEEVEVGKRTETEQRTFTETVGREVLDVNQTGDVNLRDADGDLRDDRNNRR
ncbi:YsnF/AvaK domain-containing protein [Deinococcus pimensis]|uniref:YsnF/AvaK domain-containing protein n=1 Tax=Deinococcus pimensis TaxID=309888 RepID=UPI001FE11B2C|nr:YsnF/AvaK domain-containing protein [Deinococcus pimensis]